MLIGKPAEIPSSEITPREAYEEYYNRRRFLKAAAASAVVAAGAERLAELALPANAEAATKLQTVHSPLTTTGEQLTSYNDVTTYNNYYEFGVDKDQPAKNAGGLPTRPWTIRVEGMVKQAKTFDIESLLKLKPLEERVYRHRCVEAWSMVIPWVGYSLAELLKLCDPLASAKYVEFASYFNPKVEKWASQSSIEWPYKEGLRLDEAMHSLTLLAFGLYGEVLPNQNGAPLRIVVPWKYGFKSAKSIVAIRFTDKMPVTTWNRLAPNEYGFYSNVNPNVDHPRWSQKTERRIGLPFYAQRRTTLLFNGYQDQVGSLYAGMDLRRYF
ncbi:MAG: protein-methionine-sulfoxide reductase catalytic subunit MsrP [Terracidiphilus sp.]|nr:protein-methionine-sulfoxide reductase catalytic subunit MsrP [Terracidiphilus sp.]